MYAKILIPTVCVLAAIGACHPMPPNSNIVQGVFIPAETLKTLEDKVRLNSPTSNNQSPSMQANSAPAEQIQAVSQPMANQPINQNNPALMPNPASSQHLQYTSPQQGQPANNEHNLYTNQQHEPVLTQQQPISQQQTVTQPQTMGQPQTVAQPQTMTQPQTFSLANQAQPQNQQAVLVQQPMTQNQQPMSQQPIILAQQPTQQYVWAQPNGANNQQAVLVAQPNQQTLLVSQPNNPQFLVATNQLPSNVMIQNGQLGQPIGNPNVMGQATLIETPSNGAMVGKQLQNQNVYAVVPLNNQNLPNNMSSGNTYLVPIQQVPSNTVVMNTGK